jgi:glycosyltransferase involved in cell wall biosynthesis
MSNPGPRVSVCLPVYNGEAYLPEALRSVLGQTLGDFELVISDNASTDGTGDICRRAAAEDRRVRYSRAAVNGGLAWNLNRTFALARGRYVTWIGHDDVMKPEYLARCVEPLESDGGAVLCFAGTTYIDSRGDVIKQVELTNPGAVARPSWRFHNVLCDRMCDPVCGLMRRNVLRQTRLHGGYADSDRMLLAEMALRGRFLLVPEYLFARRMHTEQTTTRYHDLRDRTLIFDPAKAGKVVFPTVLQAAGTFAAIRRAGLPVRERLRSCQHLLRWLWLRRRVVWDDLSGGLRLSARRQLFAAPRSLAAAGQRGPAAARLDLVNPM